jgi:hypothetical protein
VPSHSARPMPPRENVSVERRVVVAPRDRERIAVVTIALPAGGEVELDRTWRFVGWLDSSHERKHLIELVVESPARIDVHDE